MKKGINENTGIRRPLIGGEDGPDLGEGSQKRKGPGPSLFREAPQLVWGLIGSMYIGNILLVVINIACIPLIVLFMDRIRAYLPLGILLLSAFGVFSYRNSVFDIGIMLLFAVRVHSLYFRIRAEP